MPIKKDGTGRRWVEMEFITPGTPEQVWQALATGPGNAAWFTQAAIDERVGGALEFQFGEQGSSKGEVTEWEPPLRFGYVEREWSEGAPPVATEITITARSGNTCVVRMVHSLFSTSDEWDDQMEGFESGWPLFFAVLRLYLQHYPGRKAAPFQAMHMVEGKDLDVWKRLLSALNLSDASVGEVRTTPPVPEQLSGVVERTQQDGKQRCMIMRLESPAPGIAMIGTYGAGNMVNASVTIYFYGDDSEARAASSGEKWRNWIAAALSPVAR
jgi:uncharacterized protein YndB with AHSA1/START domain